MIIDRYLQARPCALAKSGLAKVPAVTEIKGPSFRPCDALRLRLFCIGSGIDILFSNSTYEHDRVAWVRPSCALLLTLLCFGCFVGNSEDVSLPLHNGPQSQVTATDQADYETDL